MFLNLCFQFTVNFPSCTFSSSDSNQEESYQDNVEELEERSQRSSAPLLDNELEERS